MCDSHNRFVPPDTATRRVLLVDMPRMLRELVREVVAEQPDLTVVGELDDELDLDAELARSSPDFVIVGAEDGELSAPFRALFDSRPRLKVLALEPKGESAVMWELAPSHLLIGEMSPDSLLAAIRDTRPWRWEP